MLEITMIRFSCYSWMPIFVCLLSAHGIGAAEPLSFNTHVRAILSDHCFACHGPDEGSRKARLRLDTFEGATENGIVVPGNPDASELIARIIADNPHDLMPPPEANVPLSATQIDILRRWIAEGAAYEAHWAFVPVTEAPTPPVEAAHPIDAFINARLEAEGLAASPEAGKETLLRRASLDLTGLPPTIAEMDRFLADVAPDAYEKAVDRLLATSAYGERMANDWLDVARYADSYGYQSDVANNMWPWRDWVIRAFNENLPYDQFVLWQIAGDLLPDATQDQRLATAFNRLHRQTNEGGSILEEFRTEYVADRVHTAGTAFLGMTFDCARCHDHKYDPVSQKNYFEFFAFFNNIDESGMYSHFTDAVPTPTLFLYTEGQEAKHAQLRNEIGARETELAKRSARANEEDFAAWLGSEDKSLTLPTPLASIPLDSFEDGKTPVLGGDFTARLEERDHALGSGRLEDGSAMLFNGDNGVVIDKLGDFERTDPFSVAVWIKSPATAPHEVVLHHTRAREDAGSRGWALLLQEGKPTFNLVHFWPGNAIEVQATESIAPDTWTHLLVTYDGSSAASGIRIHVNGEAASTSVVRDKLYKSIRYSSSKPAGLTLAMRFRDTGLKGGQLADLRVYDRQLSGLEAHWIAQEMDPATTTPPDNREALYQHYALTMDAEAARLRSALREARIAENEFVQSLREIAVMEEMAEPRQAYLLERGAYDAKGYPVDPGTPDAILPFPEDLPRNRLGLAQWLVDRNNPLTARVAVNRAWQLFFGRGLVETQEDFGIQGSLPTHPELLDWLAAWYMDKGWDTKALHKLIVTSAAYRRDSTPRPELKDRDPENTLLAAGPRKRLKAEHIRDQALAASGLLVPEIGGPSVKPYHPPGLWEDASSTTYAQDKGAGLYRRSMYTFWKRTVPPPNMTTFDAAEREVCTARRESTTTPLQALVLLNDPIFVESSRVLAEHLAEELPRPADRVERAFRLLTGRAPDARESEILAEAYKEQLDHFRRDPESAAAYVSVGESPAVDGDAAPRIAALAAVIQAIMNFYEFQVKI